ncbi:MAG: dinitrogenase iron-molybdenum cofactor biosynthesis protein [Clostridiales bacterium]|nr:dinitrogenase iron-molybdenum cofactor biosynthesis protein [Clostridiales bacterium]
MKIIIPTETKSQDAPVCPSFGRAPIYAIYDTEGEAYEFLENIAADSSSGAGIKAAQIVADSGADALITYRCGENAANILETAKVKIYKAQQGTIAEHVAMYIDEELPLLTESHPGFHNGGRRGR